MQLFENLLRKCRCFLDIAKICVLRSDFKVRQFYLTKASLSPLYSSITVCANCTGLMQSSEWLEFPGLFYRFSTSFSEVRSNPKAIFLTNAHKMNLLKDHTCRLFYKLNNSCNVSDTIIETGYYDSSCSGPW